MPIEDFEQNQPIAQIPSAPQPKEEKPPTPPAEDSSGETFLKEKSKHFLPWAGEEAFELTTIPTFIRKGQGLVHAIKEGDPELARREALGVAGVAALNAIPVEKVLGTIGGAALKFLPEGAADAIRSTGSWVNGIKSTAGKFVGEPIGNFLNNYMWNPLRRVASNVHTVKPDELAEFEKQSFANHRQYLDQAYKTMSKDNPQMAEELKPLMQSSGNIYANRITDPYTKEMPEFPRGTKHVISGPEFNVGKGINLEEMTPTPKQRQVTRIEMAPHPLTEIKELGPVTDNEQLANLHAESLLHAFRDQLDIKGSTGFASPNEAYEVLTSKINALRNIEPAVQNLMNFMNQQGVKFGIKDFSDMARLLREEPEKIKDLPEGLRYYPVMFGRIYDMAHEIATQHGYEMGFWDNYVNRLIKSRSAVPEDLQGMGKRLSTFVAHTNNRHWELPLAKLKGIQDGIFTKPEQVGLPKGPEGEKELQALREYLYNKEINLNAGESISAYLSAFARSEMARSVENIMHSAQVNPDVDFIRMGMTYPEWEAARELVKKASTQIYNKEGNGPMYESLKKMDTLLHSYQPGEKYGLPGGNMYHPNAVKAIAPLLKPTNPGTFVNNMLNAMRMMKALKLGGFPGSLFHALNQTQSMMAAAQGYDMLFAPKVVKTFAKPEVQELLNKYQTWGVNFSRNNKIIQDAAQMGANEIESVGGPNVKKWIDWMHNNPITKYTFAVQMPADQFVLMNYHLAKARLSMPTADMNQIGHVAAYITNYEMASLRPEIMNNLARNVGNYFLLARNWTYRNTGLVLNAMHEWFVKTPAAMGILPKEFSHLFTGGLNAIQNMENMPPEAQDYIRRELADFMGVALAQRMWRLQAMSYLISGHSTFSNEPGHELDIDSNIAEWKKGPSGKYTYHKIYLNNLGFLHDAFNIPPITPPIDVYNQTGNKWVFANPMQYVDLSKSTTVAKNKANALWTLAFDLATPKKAGESRLESTGRITKDVLSQAVPIPVETIISHWDQITFKYGIDTALEMLAISVLGQPRIMEGAAPNVGKSYGKQAKKGVLEQIETGLQTP